MKRPQKTAAQLRRANRGNVPGMLGMEELRLLTQLHKPCETPCDPQDCAAWAAQGMCPNKPMPWLALESPDKPHCRVEPKPPNPIHAAYCKREECRR